MDILIKIELGTRRCWMSKRDNLVNCEQKNVLVMVTATTQFHNTLKSSSGSSLSSLFYPKHTHSIRSKVNKLNTVFSLRGNQTGMSLNWNDKLTQAAIPWKRKRTPKPPYKEHRT